MNVKLLMRHIPVTSRDRPRRNAITARGRARSNAQIKRQRIEPELFLSPSLFSIGLGPFTSATYRLIDRPADAPYCAFHPSVRQLMFLVSYNVLIILYCEL